MKTELETQITNLEEMVYTSAKKKNENLGKTDKIFRQIQSKVNKMTVDLRKAESALKISKDEVKKVN